MANSWQLLAARPAGTVAALTTSRSADNAVIVHAATAAGLQFSEDGGRTWIAPRANRQTPGIEVVAVSPNYATDLTIFSGAPNGLFRTTDAGATWQLVLTGNRILAAAVSPAYAADRLVFAGTEADGVLRSDDGGDTWTSANAGLADLTILAIAVSPAFAEDRTALVATPTGLYRTRNGGQAWRAVELPAGEVEVQCLALAPTFATAGLAFAGTVEHGLFRSNDAGATWQAVTTLASESVTALAFSSQFGTTHVVAAATADGVMLSQDGGATWNTVGADVGPVLALVFASNGLLAGLPRQGVARLDSEGNWTTSNDGLNGNLIVAIALSPELATDQTVFTASLEDGIAVSTDGGATWTARNEGLEDSAVFGVALSPGYPGDQTLYAATSQGVSRSRDGGVSWASVLAESEPVAARGIATGSDRPGATHVLVALQTGGVLISKDAGETWSVLPFEANGAEVIALDFSPNYAQDHTLFLGTSLPRPGGDPSLVDLSLYRSADGGQTWQRWLEAQGPNALPLAVPTTYSPTNELAYVGAGQRVLRPNPGATEVRRGERKPLWRIAYLAGEPVSVTALAVAPDFRQAGHVLAATGAGVHLSTDRGATFSPWSEGLDPAPIVAVAVAPTYPADRHVYAVGLGGTIWRRAVE